jgi:hypothetical protein
MNILEQEDIIKGLPDAALQQEMSAPSGQVPQFLVLSEIQRRTDMRDRFEASEPQPTTTVRDQIMAEGLGASVPQPNMPPMPPPNMGGMLPNSPVPARPNSSSPPFPVGDAPQGLAGMGVQYASTGGVVRMQEGQQVPSSLKDLRNGEAVVLARGENPDNFSVADLEYLGRTNPNQLGFMSNFMGNNHPAFGSVQYQSPASNVSTDNAEAKPVEVAPLDYLDVLEGQSLSPEIEYEQRTGRDIDAPTRWEEASDRFNQLVADEERYPYRHLDSDFKSKMPFGERAGLELREGVTEVGDVFRTLGPASGEAVLDFATVLGTGDLRDPPLQREEGLRNVGSAYDRFVREPAARLSQPIQEWAQNFDMVESGTDAYNAAKNYLGDDLGLREWAQNFDMVEAAKELGGSIKDGLGEYMPDLYAPHPDMMEKITSFFDGDGEIKETSEGAITADSARAITEYTGTASMAPADISGGLSLDEAEGEGLEIIDTAGGTTVGGTSDNEVMDMLLEEHASFGDAQQESAESLRSLIAQNRAETKSRAFNLGMAALGAGIAKGDMGAGMDEAVKVASNTLAKGEAAVAPLEAAAVTEKTQGSKDRLESLAQIARADAGYRQVRAQLVREGGLTARNYNTLKVATMRAVENLMEDTFIEGTETTEGKVQVFNQLMNMLMGDVGTLMDTRADSYQSQLVRNPEGSPSTFRYVVPQS